MNACGACMASHYCDVYWNLFITQCTRVVCSLTSFFVVTNLWMRTCSDGWKFANTYNFILKYEKHWDFQLIYYVFVLHYTRYYFISWYIILIYNPAIPLTLEWTLLFYWSGTFYTGSEGWQAYFTYIPLYSISYIYNVYILYICNSLETLYRTPSQSKITTATESFVAIPLHQFLIYIVGFINIGFILLKL